MHEKTRRPTIRGLTPSQLFPARSTAPMGARIAEDRYDAVREQWAKDPSLQNARRLDRARIAVHTARTLEAGS